MKQLLVISALIISAFACRTVHVDQAPPAAQPMREAALPPAGISQEAAAMAHRVQLAPAEPAGGAVPARFGQWYQSSGSPRVIVLLNRQFVTDDAEFRADARMVMKYNDITVSSQSGGGKPDARQRTESGGDAIVQLETRRGHEPYLSQRDAWALREAFMRPLQQAGVRLVDAEAATRLQQLSDSEKEQTAARRDFKNAQTASFVNRADILIELLAVRNHRGDLPYSLTAKAIDLKSGSILLVRNSDNIVAPLDIPGNTEPVQGPSIEATADALARSVMHDLAK